MRLDGVTIRWMLLRWAIPGYNKYMDRLGWIAHLNAGSALELLLLPTSL